jgi:hypothetical protein
MHTTLRRILLACLVLPACGDDGGDPTTTTGTTGAETSATDPAPTTGAATDPSAGATDDATDTTAGDSTGPATDPGSTGDTTGGVADCGFDHGLAFARDAPVWQLVSDDGATCVWLERRDDSEPDVIYKAVPYTLLEFKAGYDGAVAHVADLARLTWTSTHHNWADTAEAVDGGVRYVLADHYGVDFADTFHLSAVDAGTDAPVWGPVVVRPFAP